MFAYSKTKQAASKIENISCKQRYLGSTMCFMQCLHFSKAVCKQLAAGELIKMHYNINISCQSPPNRWEAVTQLRSVGTLPGHSVLYGAEKPLISTTALNIPLARAKRKRVKLLILPKASWSKSYRSLPWVFTGTDVCQCTHTPKVQSNTKLGLSSLPNPLYSPVYWQTFPVKVCPRTHQHSNTTLGWTSSPPENKDSTSVNPQHSNGTLECIFLGISLNFCMAMSYGICHLQCCIHTWKKISKNPSFTVM